MTRRVDLPSGGWVELAESVSGVTERQRRPIRLLYSKLSPAARANLQADVTDPAGFSLEDMTVMCEVGDYVAAALIVGSSFAAAARVTVDEICDLPAADYDTIVEAVGPMIGSVMSGVDFDPNPNPDSPTVPSSD